jgi:hypothetical protein
MSKASGRSAKILFYCRGNLQIDHINSDFDAFLEAAPKLPNQIQTPFANQGVWIRDVPLVQLLFVEVDNRLREKNVN